MASRTLALVRSSVLTLAVLAVPAASASAQVQAQFYAPYPSPPGPVPDPFAPFPNGSLVCTTDVGRPTGFFLNFINAATQTFLQGACGAAAAAQLVHSFGARFTGSLVAPGAGSYTLAFDADDGDRLTINGTIVSTQWFDKGAGPGSINVTLNAGANPFVFDYYENTFGGAYARLQLPPGLPAVPPAPSVAPEPATVTLLGIGLLGVVGVARRRRTRG